MNRCRRPRHGAAIIAAIAAIAVTVSLIDRRIDDTIAAWVDTEHVHGAIGVRDCNALGNYASAGSGRLLSGDLLGIDLDTVAAATGVVVVNDGTVANATPGATPLGDDAYQSTLDVALLGAQVPTLNVALQLPLASQVAGIYDQYAQARSNGTSAGAAGAVTDNGAIMVGESNPDPGLPGTGTLHLAGLAPTVTPLADLRLELGALAASAVLDACTNPATVTRDYGIASLHLMQDGPAIDSLRSSLLAAVTTTQTTITGLQATLNAIVGGLLNTLGLVTVSTTITIDLPGAVAPLLDAVLTDDDEIVTIDLVQGSITVDLARLVTGSPHGLNGRDPNTELLDPAFVQSLIPAVTTIVTGLLNELVTNILAAVTSAIGNAEIEINATLLPLIGSGIPLLRIHGPLTSPSITVLSGLVLNGNTILNTVVSTITNTINTAVSTLGTTLSSLTAQVTAALSAALVALDGVVSVMVNVQPDQPSAPPTPPPPVDAWRVSALRVGVLSGTFADTHLHLATATAGPNTRL